MILEYLHRSPMSRKKRQKETLLKRDSKTWPQVLRDLHLRVTAMAGPSSTCTTKFQTRSLIREGVPW
jgi:hypothetical protein